MKYLTIKAAIIISMMLQIRPGMAQGTDVANGNNVLVVTINHQPTNDGMAGITISIPVAQDDNADINTDDDNDDMQTTQDDDDTEAGETEPQNMPHRK